MWMRSWGLLDANASIFMQGRKMKILDPVLGTLTNIQVPREILHNSYNPSIIQVRFRPVNVQTV
eukprot:6202413-Pleurochrysis_carterae.AAC.1